MTGARLPELLAQLSDDLIFALDADGVVCAADPRAANLLGADPLGRPWAELMAARSREKGLAFLASLGELGPEATTEGWELQLHVAGAAPLLVMARGGRLADGTLLVAARNEVGRLSTLYYEALAINDDLNALARRLTRENTALAARLASLEQERSAAMKLHETELAVAQTLEAHREEVCAPVAEALASGLPMVGLNPALADRAARHQERMRSTAQRFHQIVQAGVTLDWSMVAHEFNWGARVLGQHGVTADHLQTLIEVYFKSAAGLPWSDEERAALDRIASRLRQLAEQAYSADPNAP